MYNIIELLEKTSSSNEKIEILKKYKDNELFKRILYYTYNPLFNYYTRHQIEEYRQYESVDEGSEINIELLFPILDKFVNREITGHNSVDYLEDIGNDLFYHDRIILNRIIARDMRCGISAKTINKVFPNLIPEIPYMRCSLTDKIDRITYPAIVQKKEDSIFVNVVYRNNDIKFYTRNGTEFDLVALKDELLNTFHVAEIDENIVLHGELLVGSESRKIASGLINSLIKKEQTIESLQTKIVEKRGNTHDKLVSELAKKLAEYDQTDKNLRIVLWDVVPYEKWTIGEYKESYHERFKYLFTFESDHVKVVEYEIVSNYDEALEFYRKQIANGYEGAVLKNFKMIWKNHTSTEQIKLKAERECELRVISIENGQGKYEGKIGSLVCESSDKLLKVNVGSGLTDTDRDMSPSAFVGKVISVKFNEVIQSDSKDTYSLFLPRFIEIRNDKDEADSLEHIKKL